MRDAFDISAVTVRRSDLRTSHPICSLIGPLLVTMTSGSPFTPGQNFRISSAADAATGLSVCLHLSHENLMLKRDSSRVCYRACTWLTGVHPLVQHSVPIARMHWAVGDMHANTQHHVRVRFLGDASPSKRAILLRRNVLNIIPPRAPSYPLAWEILLILRGW